MYIKFCRNCVKSHFGELYFETYFGELFRSWNKDQGTGEPWDTNSKLVHECVYVCVDGQVKYRSV